MALSSPNNAPIIARKFGRTLERIEHLPNVCLKYQKVGKIGVSCQFRLSKSRWGVLGEAENPAGIIFMSLGFDQPSDCRLSKATISITLEENEAIEATGRQSSRDSISNSLHITDRYGPKQLSGPERRISIKRNRHLTPNINILGNGAGGVGIDTTKEVIVSSRWIFNGRLRPASHPTQKGRHTAVYRTLEWELTESDFEPQSAHSNMIHTAFAFEHEGKPFLMEVNIRGKLKNKTDEILRHLKFSSDQDKSKGSASTFIHLPRGDPNSARLDALADSLPKTMEIANLEEVPTEIPDVLPASIYMGRIAEAVPRERVGANNSTPGTCSEPRQPTLIASSTERVTVHSVPMDLNISNVASTDPTYPSIENLSRASLIFTNMPQERTKTSERHRQSTSSTTSEPGVDSRDGTQSENGSTWFASDTTLVGEQDAEQQIGEMRLAKHKDIQDSLMLISESPYLILLLKLFLGLMTIFRKKQELLEKPPSSFGKHNDEDGKVSQE